MQILQLHSVTVWYPDSASLMGHWKTANTQRAARKDMDTQLTPEPCGCEKWPPRTWSFTGPLSITDACSAARNGDRAGSSRMTATCLCITAAVCSYSRAITSGLSARMKSCHYVECNVLSVRPGEQSKSISAVLTLNQIPKKDRTEWGICFVQWSKHGCSWTHTYIYRLIVSKKHLLMWQPPCCCSTRQRRRYLSPLLEIKHHFSSSCNILLK